MQKAAAVLSSDFESQARKTVSLAFDLCEVRIKMNKGTVTPELEAFTAAALSLEKIVAVYMAVERLCR